MKILALVHNFPPEFVGGTEAVVAAQAHALAARGHEVSVLSGSERRQEFGGIRREDVRGLSVIRLLRRPEEDYAIDGARPRVRLLVEDLVRAAHPDVVHVHHWATLSSDLVRASKAAGIPAVVTLHDLWTTCPRFFRTPIPGVSCPEDGSREPCVKCVRAEAGLPPERLAAAFASRDASALDELNAAAAVLAPSRAHASRLAALLPGLAREIRVLPHGLLAAPGPRSQPRSAPPFRIGSFGNLAPAKGVDLLLDAIRGLSAQASVEVSLEGRVVDAAYGSRLRELARGLPVRIGGAFPPGRAVEVASHLDLAVFPSLAHESYGLVVDEAFAAGVPVIVSDRGALPERIGSGGLVVPAGDAARLRAAIERFVTDRELRERLRAGVPKQVRTGADAAADLEALYASIVGESSR